MIITFIITTLNCNHLTLKKIIKLWIVLGSKQPMLFYNNPDIPFILATTTVRQMSGYWRLRFTFVEWNKIPRLPVGVSHTVGGHNWLFFCCFASIDAVRQGSDSILMNTVVRSQVTAPAETRLLCYRECLLAGCFLLLLLPSHYYYMHYGYKRFHKVADFRVISVLNLKSESKSFYLNKYYSKYRGVKLKYQLL